LSSNVIVECKDVEFIDNKFQTDSNSINEWTNNSKLKSTTNACFDPSSRNKRIQKDHPFEIWRSQRARKEKILHPDYISSQSIVFLVEGNMIGVLNKIPILLILENGLKTYKEAMMSRDVTFWKETINDEMNSLLYNNT